MERYKVGMLAESKAGHDRGRRYVIVKEDDAYVYLADGRIRTQSTPKKKKKKHVQPICIEHEAGGLDDNAIKRILKNFNKDRKNQEEMKYVKN